MKSTIISSLAAMLRASSPAIPPFFGPAPKGMILLGPPSKQTILLGQLLAETSLRYLQADLRSQFEDDAVPREFLEAFGPLAQILGIEESESQQQSVQAGKTFSVLEMLIALSILEKYPSVENVSALYLADDGVYASRQPYEHTSQFPDGGNFLSRPATKIIAALTATGVPRVKLPLPEPQMVQDVDKGNLEEVEISSPVFKQLYAAYLVFRTEMTKVAGDEEDVERLNGAARAVAKSRYKTASFIMELFNLLFKASLFEYESATVILSLRGLKGGVLKVYDGWKVYTRRSGDLVGVCDCPVCQRERAQGSSQNGAVSPDATDPKTLPANAADEFP